MEKEFGNGIFVKDIEEHFTKVLKHVHETGFRHLFFLSSDAVEKTSSCLIHLFSIHAEFFKTKSLFHEVLIVLGDRENRLGVTPLIDFFTKSDIHNARIVSHKESLKTLGVSCDLLILDLRNDLNLSDLDIFIETVNMGGLVVLLIDETETWKTAPTSFHETLQVPREDSSVIKYRFKTFLIEKSKQEPGISILNLDARLISPLKLSEPPPSDSEKPIVFPSNSWFDLNLYKFTRSQDQADGLFQLEHLVQEATSKKKIFFITSDRGRGKSSLLGISAAALGDKLRRRKRSRLIMTITAPEKQNYKVLFLQLKRVLEKSGINYSIKYHDRSLTSRDRTQITNISRLNTKNMQFNLVSPHEACKFHSDILIIDEAAAIPFTILTSLLQTSSLILMASTIHGYEGVGRMFSLKFLPFLKSQKFVLNQHELTTPIRYKMNDPLEKWLYEVSFLRPSAYLTDITSNQDINSHQTSFQRLDLDECFLRGNHQDFKEFIGIIVMAHYRNNPNDVLRLAESSNHEAWVLKDENSRKILVSMHTVKEGKLSGPFINEMLSDKNYPGNILPWIAVLYFRDSNFPRLSGLRVVRIATHPSLTKRGFGSRALSSFEDSARSEGHDWIGTTFGATLPLYRFWRKNGYVPFHLSPRVTPSTGEHSIFMIKPLTDPGKINVDLLNQEFKIRFIDWIRHVFYDVDSDLLGEILEDLKKVSGAVSISQSLSNNQRVRLQAYIKKQIDDTVAIDSILTLLKTYFISHEKQVHVAPLQRILIVKRILQARTWHQVLRETDLKIDTARGMLRKAIKKIYAGISVEQGNTILK